MWCRAAGGGGKVALEVERWWYIAGEGLIGFQVFLSHQESWCFHSQL